MSPSRRLIAKERINPSRDVLRAQRELLRRVLATTADLDEAGIIMRDLRRALYPPHPKRQYAKANEQTRAR
jgi:hypothetical protein